MRHSMPILRGLQVDSSTLLCACEENNCPVALEPRHTIAWINTEELFRGISAKHCDCILIRRKDDTIELYSIELKNIQPPTQTDKKAIQEAMERIAREALNPENLASKCRECLRKAETLLGNLIPAEEQARARIEKYCVVAIPPETLALILDRLYSLLKHLDPQSVSTWRSTCSQAWITACGGRASERTLPLYSPR